jgi:hypothetical protein
MPHRTQIRYSSQNALIAEWSQAERSISLAASPQDGLTHHFDVLEEETP